MKLHHRCSRRTLYEQFYQVNSQASAIAALTALAVNVQLARFQQVEQDIVFNVPAAHRWAMKAQGRSGLPSYDHTAPLGRKIQLEPLCSIPLPDEA